MSPHPRTLGTGPNWLARALLCLLVFALTGPAVYFLGRRGTGKPKTYSATALVRQEAAAPREAPRTGPAEARRREEEIRRLILAEESLRRTLGPDAGPHEVTSERLDTLRRNLSVAVDDTPAGKLEIAVTATGPEAEGVVHVANALARHYADSQHTRREAAARQQVHAARQAAAAAARQWQRAQANLDAFVEECLSRPTARPSAPEQAAPAPASADTPPPLLINPRWLELDGGRAELVRTRDELLIDRTPQHPAVLSAIDRIAKLEEQMARTPREIPGEPAAPQAAPSPRAPAPPADGPGRPSDRSAELADLRERVDLARARHEQLAAAERQAWDAYHQIPAVEIVPAEESRLVDSAGPGLRPLLLALSVALASGLGVGMVLVGTGRDPLLATPQQVARTLPIPILGTLSIPASTPAEHPQPHGAGARATAVCGIVLILASLAAAMAAIG